MSWRLLLRVGISVGLLTWLASRADLTQVAGYFGRLDSGVIGALVTLYVIGVLVAAVKWRLLVPAFTVRLLAMLTLVGQYYSVVLPGQIAGEVMKAYRLGKGHTDAERIAASVVIDKATGLAALLVLGIAGLAISSLRLPPLLLAMLAAALAVGLAGLFALRIPVLSGWVTRLLDRIGAASRRAAPLAARFQEFFNAWRQFLLTPSTLVASLLLGALYQGINALILWRIGSAYAIPVSLSDWAWILTVVSIALVLPLSVGGIGIREGAFVGVLAFLGIGREPALAVSFTVFGLQVLGAALGAALEIAGVRRPP